MSFRTVAKVGELAPGESKAVTIGDVDLVLYRVADEYFSTQRKCLHQGGDLADAIISKGFVVCSHHFWKFDVRTGRHEISPETCLRTYAVRVDGDAIQIDPTPIWQGEIPK